MKLFLLALGVAAFATPFTTADEPKREPKPRFKGVEMYSWKDDKKGWQFVLVNGTNRQKTEQEVKSAPTVYSGIDKLTAALHLLAEGEDVYWFHRTDGFEYPPAADLKKLDAAAKAAKVKLARDR